MKKIIKDAVFPEGNGATWFPSCFTSVWMRMEGVTTERQAGSAKPPYGECCGRCGWKKHLGLYHHGVQNFYSVVSGLPFMQLDLSNDEHFTNWYINRVLEEYDDYIKFTMGFAGFTYEYFDKQSEKSAVWEAVRKSIDADRPALMRFGPGYEWYVITGYDEKNGALYGLGSKEYWKDKPGAYKGDMFVSEHWYEHMAEAVIVTGKSTPTVTLDDVFRRTIGILEAMEKMGYFQRSADYLNDNANFEGYDHAQYLALAERICSFFGLPVDSRDAGCPFKNLANVEIFQDRAQYFKRIAALYDSNCEVSCVAWDMVGSYKREIEEPAKMLPSPLYRHAIARVIEVVINNNRRVAECMKEMMGE